MMKPDDFKTVPHSDKVNTSNLHMGYVTPAKRFDVEGTDGWLEERCEGDYVQYTDYKAAQARAEAWDGVAERLYKSAICDCTEGTGTPCARCLNTIQAYTALKRSGPESKFH